VNPRVGNFGLQGLGKLGLALTPARHERRREGVRDVAEDLRAQTRTVYEE